MEQELRARLQAAPIVPLIQSDDPAVALRIAKALVSGGLTVLEVVLRTDQALECMKNVSSGIPDSIVGAGTVLSAQQANLVAEAGAAFIVSPGFDEGVVEVAQNKDLPVYPGIATASELQRAWNMGIDAVKFFPAGQAGGTAMLKALGSVFRDVRFMPTGGISAANLSEYLALPAVLACGGSWLTPANEIANENFDAVTRLAEEALAIVNRVRNG